MKVILLLCVLFGYFSASAQNSVPTACTKRVLSYRTRLSNAANEINFRLNASKNADGPLSAADSQLQSDADGLQDALANLHQRANLSTRQMQIINSICRAQHLDSDSVMGALEEIGR